MSNFGFHWRKRTTFSYCHASNIRVLANLKSDGTTLSSFDYDYDAVGNRTRVVETMEGNSSRTTYSYDDAYQLLREHRTGSQPFDYQNAYDPAGNRLVKDIDGQRTTYAYNEANQIQTAQDLTGFTTFTFDADGNQLVEQAPSGDRTTNAWDFENRRTIVELPSGVRNTATYDPDGLRVALADSIGHKNFIWDEQNVLTETDDTHATQAVYTLEPLTYGRLISQRRGSDSHWHLFNALGTTAQLIDGVQTVTDSCILDAWGVPIAVSGTTINPYRYVGEYGYYFDPDTALYYVRARIYQPTIARWLSVDPIGFVDGLNGFRYARSNPLLGIDPSGLATYVCCKFAFLCRPGTKWRKPDVRIDYRLVRCLDVSKYECCGEARGKIPPISRWLRKDCPCNKGWYPLGENDRGCRGFQNTPIRPSPECDLAIEAYLKALLTNDPEIIGGECAKFVRACFAGLGEEFFVLADAFYCHGAIDPTDPLPGLLLPPGAGI